MSYQPKLTLPDHAFDSVKCTICGKTNLQVIHMEELPDFINCTNCKAAFVVADDDTHIMYGEIPLSFPETKQHALRQWVLPEFVERIAQKERPERNTISEPASSAPVTPHEDAALIQETARRAPVEVAGNEIETAAAQPASDAGASAQPIPAGRAALWKEEPLPSPEYILEALAAPDPTTNTLPPPPSASAMSSSESGTQKAAAQPPLEKPATPQKEIAAQIPATRDKSLEPEAGRRYRLTVNGDAVRFPHKVCAHCLSSSVNSWLEMGAWVPAAENSLERKQTRFRIPLCTDCRNRANQVSETAKRERARAFLTGTGTGLFMLLVLILTGVLTKMPNPLYSVMTVLMVAILGFTIPTFFLYERSRRLPPPADAIFVRTTLFIPPDPPENGILLDWRNRGYAELFFRTNRSNINGNVMDIPDNGPRIIPEPAHKQTQPQLQPESSQKREPPSGKESDPQEHLTEGKSNHT